ncbi:MAG: hypothetical protein DRJ98_00425 [Thermoprotei archaeon]|nr:MAG: hypothetical protein DRJ98_00425 [Thermoprotei archaeon]RLF16727.1 MAG: hypothetical protein DRN06_04950 [Thermoprotei archaeon]
MVIKIKYEPFKEIVVKEIVEYPSPDSLARFLGAYLKAGQLIVPNWTEGVLFCYFPLPLTTESLVKEYFDGRVYWSTIMFTLMPTYQEVLKIDAAEVPVIDVSHNPSLKRIAKWLKARFKGQS